MNINKIAHLFFSIFFVGVFWGDRTIGEELHCKVQPNSYVISLGDRPIMEYRYGQVSMKPYVERLYTPAGINILRDSPHDHVHHHSLMFAVAADGIDFWTERPQERFGRQRTVTVGPSANAAGGIQSQLTWIKPDGKPAVNELRNVHAIGSLDDVTLLCWESILSVPEGRDKITIDGSHYFGLGLRFVESMDRGGRFFNSEKKLGPIVRGDERVTPCRWCAYTAKVDDRPVTVAVFDRPGNPRGMYAFTMGDAGGPFAYLSATMNYYKESLEVKADEPMTIGYGVALWDGEKSADQVEAAYQKWLELQEK